jgi:DNA invertase Pin-like site-specific DNA recombinase
VTEGNTEPAECASEITASIKILPVVQIPLYQKIAQKATKLRLLGMGYKDIAKSLNVSKTTIIRALVWQHTQRGHRQNG